MLDFHVDLFSDRLILKWFYELPDGILMVLDEHWICIGPSFNFQPGVLSRIMPI